MLQISQWNDKDLRVTVSYLSSRIYISIAIQFMYQKVLVLQNRQYTTFENFITA